MSLFVRYSFLYIFICFCSFVFLSFVVYVVRSFFLYVCRGLLRCCFQYKLVGYCLRYVFLYVFIYFGHYFCLSSLVMYLCSSLGCRSLCMYFFRSQCL